MKKTSKHPTVALTTPHLRTLCDQAEALRFSNGPNEKFWKEVDPNGHHVVELWFVHQPVLAFWEGVQHEWDFSHGGGRNIRALVLCKMRGRMKPCVLKCDFDHDAFMKLVKPTQRYVSIGTLPRSQGNGYLCHNHIKHETDTPCGENGFRAWRTDQLPPDFVRCNCGWAGLTHYANEKLKGDSDQDAFTTPPRYKTVKRRIKKVA